jgi:transcriptional regulator with XRE-family HTH domain
MPEMLDKDELKRRIDAFRTLRGLTQVDLAELFASKGHGTQELGRLERGVLPLTEIRRRSLAEILGVPEAWFVDATLDLAGYTGEMGLAGIQRSLDAILQREERAQDDRDAIMALLAKQDQILTDIGSLLTRQTQILTEMQRVAEGLPSDEALRLLNEGARQLEAAQALREARAAQSTDLGGTYRRRATDR